MDLALVLPQILQMMIFDCDAFMIGFSLLQFALSTNCTLPFFTIYHLKVQRA